MAQGTRQNGEGVIQRDTDEEGAKGRGTKVKRYPL